MLVPGYPQGNGGDALSYGGNNYFASLKTFRIFAVLKTDWL